MSTKTIKDHLVQSGMQLEIQPQLQYQIAYEIALLVVKQLGPYVALYLAYSASASKYSNPSAKPVNVMQKPEFLSEIFEFLFKSIRRRTIRFSRSVPVTL